MKNLHIDIETFSPVDLKAFGVYPYSEHPDFMVLMASYSVDQGPVRRIELNDESILAIPGLFDSNVLKTAHNAAFERVCFSRLAGLPVGSYLNPREWHDTQAVAAELGYPLKLEHLAKALGGEQKDSAGTRLINVFCKPNRKGQRTLPEEKPEQWAQFGAYCDQDVVTLLDVDARMGGWPTDAERAIHLADQAINDRGFLVDLELAAAAVEAGGLNQLEQEVEVSLISGVHNPGSNEQLARWLRKRGLKLPNMQADTITDALDGKLPGDVRRVLELRQELALVAQKKFASAIGTANSDSRLRGRFFFHGAHTGRWTGKGVQPHNMPRASLHLKDRTDAENAAHVEAAILDLKMGLGADAFTLKALVRPMLLGPMCVADFSAIEARCIAWEAGEEWMTQAFLDGRDIYVETAGRMGGMSRSEGKIAVLALGYNGGVGSIKALGGGNLGDDSQLQAIVTKYRKSVPRTVKMWQQMEDAFCRGRGDIGSGVVTAERDGSTRILRLPSGRGLHYRQVRIKEIVDQYGRPKRDITMADSRYGRGSTYGGRLTENVTQAIARDILGHSLVNLEREGFRTVAHVHDEVLVEAPASELQTIIDIMCEMPDWARGLPMGAAGFSTDRYKKD